MPDEEMTENAESETAETPVEETPVVATEVSESTADDVESDGDWVEQLPEAEVVITYLGPVAPHWEVRYVSGDEALVDAFRHRVDARLMLLPQHDPQWRRNRERVDRDAERELIAVTWELED